MISERAPASTEHRYLFDNAWQVQRQRLAALEAMLDPGTIRHLEARGVGDGWRCLEVGAGGGSIAEWLCQRVGRRGRVVATDLDTRFLEAIDQPNLEVRRHDIATDELEEGAYDLVHTRYVLLHVPGREAALRRMVAALKPGGWLVAEEPDFAALAPVPGPDAAATALAQKLFAAHHRVLEMRGGDPFLGRRLMRDLRAQGLTELGADGRTSVLPCGPGSVGQTLGRLTFQQLREPLIGSGLATGQEVDGLLALFDDPDFAVMMAVTVAAWGQRPAAGGTP